MGIYLIPLCVIVAILVIAFLFASLQQVKHKTRYIVLYVIAIVMLFAVIPINEYLIKFTQISSEENLLILIFDIAVGYFCMYIAGLLKFNLLKQKNQALENALTEKQQKNVDALLKHQNEKQKTLLKGELEWLTEKIKVFTEEEQKNAVADMGDPVEVGISLDRIHKPKIAWRLLVIVGILSLLGILIQQSILRQPGYQELETWRQEVYRYTTEGFVSCIVIGFLLMCVIYFLDYTLIAKYSRFIGGAILILGGLRVAGFGGLDVNGIGNWIGFGRLRVAVTSLMMFYVPIYGAILYKYRDGGVSALCRAILWLILPVFITSRIPSLGVAVIMMVSMLIELTVAVWKGWFQLPVKKTIIGVWLFFAAVPAILLTVKYAFHMLETYQEARIRSYLSHSGDANYMTATLHKFNENILLWGNSGKDVVGGLPEFNQDYIFSYILNSYGLLAGIFVAAILAALVLFMFGAAARQKNELGMVMGFGCGMIILLNISLNFAGMLGWIPLTSTFLPFLSVGRNNILLCYALVGIILSIYRYKDVYPKKFKASQVSLQKTITLKLDM